MSNADINILTVIRKWLAETFKENIVVDHSYPTDYVAILHVSYRANHMIYRDRIRLFHFNVDGVIHYSCEMTSIADPNIFKILEDYIIGRLATLKKWGYEYAQKDNC